MAKAKFKQKSVGAFEAKTHFSALLNYVEKQYATVDITRHGRLVAKLIPVEQGETPEEIRKKSLKQLSNEKNLLNKMLRKG